MQCYTRDAKFLLSLSFGPRPPTDVNVALYTNVIMCALLPDVYHYTLLFVVFDELIGQPPLIFNQTAKFGYEPGGG